MSKNIVVKLKYPQNITLYMNGNNPNIYYYFTDKKTKKIYRGSTGTPNRDEAISLMSSGFVDQLIAGRVRKGKKKVYTISDISKRFIEDKKSDKLSPKTLGEYERQSKFLSEFFKGRDIDEFGSEKDYIDYSKWRRKYYKNKKYPQKLKRGQRHIKRIGNCTINRECRLLVSILRYAKKLNFLKGKEIPPYKLKPEGRREEVPTKEEYLRLKKFWSNKNIYYWYIIDFVTHTGVRYPSELNRICWKDVNLDHNYVMIRNRKTKRKDKVLNTPVPLVGKSKTIIENLRNRENIPVGDEDPVFVNENGIQVQNIRKAFKNSLKKCKIDRNLSMYSLRHLYTTIMVQRPDIPLKMVSFSLGHTDSTMVDKHYAHMRADEIIEIFKKSEENKKKDEIPSELKTEISEDELEILKDKETFEAFKNFYKIFKEKN